MVMSYFLFLSNIKKKMKLTAFFGKNGPETADFNEDSLNR